MHDSIKINVVDADTADEIKKIVRSMSSALQTINEMRNHKSLVHPNKKIVDRKEAEFSIRVVKAIADYINYLLKDIVEC